MFVQHQSGHLWNNFCYDCSQHIKQRLKDEKMLLTKACRDSWNKTKQNNEAKKTWNGWDFKLRNIKMQAVIFTQFAIIKCHDPTATDWTDVRSLKWLLTYTICKTVLYLTTTSSTNVHQCCTFLFIPLERLGGAWPEMIILKKEGVSQHLFLGHILWCFRVFWAVCFIEYSYCWCSCWWLAIIMPGGQVAWP